MKRLKPKKRPRVKGHKVSDPLYVSGDVPDSAVFQDMGRYGRWLQSLIKVLKFFDVLRLARTGRFLVSLLSEPKATLKTCYQTVFGYRFNFSYYNLNPLWITEAQSKLRPILLIHGNYHNQAAWYPFAERAKKEDGIGPVYTVNLPSKEITEEDFAVLHKKYTEILDQYFIHGKEPIIDIIGHSRGASVAHSLALSQEDPTAYESHIGMVFLIGSPLPLRKRVNLSQETLQKIFEIDGCYDILVTRRSLQDATHRLSVPEGHLGLLHAKEVHNFLIRHLQAQNKQDIANDQKKGRGKPL